MSGSGAIWIHGRRAAGKATEQELFATTTKTNLRPNKFGQYALGGYHIQGSLIVERIPVMAPRLNKWQVQWELLQRQKMLWRLSKAPMFIRKDLQKYFMCEYMDAFYHGDTVTEDDKTRNLQSYNRLLDQTLFLVVKTPKHDNSGFHWTFPSAFWKPNENLRETMIRGFLQYGIPPEDFDCFLTGSAPIAYHQIEYPGAHPDHPDFEFVTPQDLNGANGLKTFFLRAYHTNGNLRIIPGKVEDFVWVQKSKLPQFIDPVIYDTIKPVLDH
eukprot:TRINITY_DN5926_c0_g1_i1.p1 TRINITY_DN5926_c0_g1~~TRINITY_DN5926_c0_g1_i1.p1  ORF type:complete len:270 (+),score=65.48 TRINITY_DN5926_c0_g1_i1:99-908(+)